MSLRITAALSFMFWALCLAPLKAEPDLHEKIKTQAETSPKTLLELASSLYSEGRFEESEITAKEALSILEKRYGINNPKTVPAILRLAECAHRQRKYFEAQELLSRALSIRENAFGNVSIKICPILKRIASTMTEQGRFSESIPYYERMIDICVQTPEDIIKASSARIELAGIYTIQRRYADAIETYNCALSDIKRNSGASHPLYEKAAQKLAELYEASDNSEELAKFQESVVSDLTEAFGAQDKRSMDAAIAAAQAFARSRNYEKAQEYFIKASHSKQHAIQALTGLSDIYKSQGMYEKSMQFMTEAIKTIKDTNTVPSLDEASTLASAASLQLLCGSADEASRFCEMSLDIRKKMLKGDAFYVPETLVVMQNLADIRTVQGRFDEAQNIYQEILRHSDAVFGEKHPFTATVILSLARLYEQMGRNEEAESLQQKIKNYM